MAARKSLSNRWLYTKAAVVALFGCCGLSQAQPDSPSAFRVLVTTVGSVGSSEVAVADSLLGGVEDYLADFADVETVRWNGPFADFPQALQEAVQDGSRAQALAALSITLVDSATVVGVRYRSLTTPVAAPHPDSAYDQTTELAVAGWPPGAASDTARVLVPILGEFVLGAAYSQRNMLEDAMGRLEHMIGVLEGTTLEGFQSGYHALRARNLFYIIEDRDAALREMDRAIELDSENSNVYLYRGAMRSHMGDYQGAWDDLTLAISNDSSNADAWRRRGGIELMFGENRLAAEDLTRAIELGLDGPEVLNGRAMALVAMGHREQAMADLNAAIEKDSTFTDAFMNAIVFYGALGETGNAAELARSAMRANPEDRYFPVMLHLVNEDWPRVIQSAGEGIAQHSEDPFFYMWRAAAHSQEGSYALALADYEQVRDFFAADNYGTVTNPRDQDIAGEIARLRDFIDLPEGSAEYYIARAQFHIDNMDYEKAVDDFTEALAIPGTDPELYYQCALCRERAGDIHQAMEDLEAFLESGAGNSQRRRMAQQMLERLRQ